MKLSDLLVKLLVAKAKREEIEMAEAGDVVDLPDVRGLRVFGTRSYLTLSLVVEVPKKRD